MSVIIHRKLIRTEEATECTLCEEPLLTGEMGVLIVTRAGLNFETNGHPKVIALCLDCAGHIGKAAEGCP